MKNSETESREVEHIPPVPAPREHMPDPEFQYNQSERLWDVDHLTHVDGCYHRHPKPGY